MKSELVSVIIPVYNSGAYIEKCIDSILNQTYTNLEIICIDDGSTDNSLELLLEYGKKDSRIKVISKDNDGASRARNVGIEFSLGEYITFVDSDDEVESVMYEKLVQELENQEVDIAHCSYKKVDLDGSIRSIGDTGVRLLQDNEEAIDCLLSGKYFTGSPCNKLYRRSAIGNIRFNENIRINEDVLFNFEVFRRSRKILFIDRALYCYYERDNSICSTTNSVRKSVDCAKVSKIILNECNGTGLEAKATYRHYMMLMNEYRCWLLDTNEVDSNFMNGLKEELLAIKAQIKRLSFKQRVNLRIMLTAPYLYKFMYGKYNHIRKPNWDVN